MECEVNNCSIARMSWKYLPFTYILWQCCNKSHSFVYNFGSFIILYSVFVYISLSTIVSRCLLDRCARALSLSSSFVSYVKMSTFGFNPIPLAYLCPVWLTVVSSKTHRMQIPSPNEMNKSEGKKIAFKFNNEYWWKTKVSFDHFPLNYLTVINCILSEWYWWNGSILCG